MGDTIFIRHSNIATNGLHLTKRLTHCVILSGAAEPQKKQMIKSNIAAESNPVGAPAGGISAVRKGMISQNPEHRRHDVRTFPINALKVLEGVWG